MSEQRWRIPLGAVLVHICIGSVYAWSTFNRPIQQLFPDAPWWFSPPTRRLPRRSSCSV